MLKRAFITGISGQDGYYLSELLLEKGYEVHGLLIPSDPFVASLAQKSDNDGKIKVPCYHIGDLSDQGFLTELLSVVKPDEVYNLAAISQVKQSFEIPVEVAEINAVGVTRLLEAIRKSNKGCRFFQASTAELFGRPKVVPQTEETPFYPISPYAVSKMYAHWLTINYRETYKMHASNGIFYNHESPRRAKNFVSKKISREIAMIKMGMQEYLHLGNIDSKRDWGYAPDFVLAMWMMLQHTCADDYIIATGETHSVREFVEKAFSLFDVPIAWQGAGIDEIGINSETGKTLVMIDSQFFRPQDTGKMHGDPSKIMRELGWKPTVTFEGLVEIMVKADYDELLKSQKNQ